MIKAKNGTRAWANCSLKNHFLPLNYVGDFFSELGFFGLRSHIATVCKYFLPLQQFSLSPLHFIKSNPNACWSFQCLLKVEKNTSFTSWQSYIIEYNRISKYHSSKQDIAGCSSLFRPSWEIWPVFLSKSTEEQWCTLDESREQPISTRALYLWTALLSAWRRQTVGDSFPSNRCHLKVLRFEPITVRAGLPAPQRKACLPEHTRSPIKSAKGKDQRTISS